MKISKRSWHGRLYQFGWWFFDEPCFGERTNLAAYVGFLAFVAVFVLPLFTVVAAIVGAWMLLCKLCPRVEWKE